MENFYDLSKKHGTDKVGHHGYHLFYPRYLDSLRDERFKMLEIGYQDGCSARMWKEYFPYSDVYCMDINTGGFIDGCTVIKGDQSKCEDLLTVKETIESAKFIIDDGSHNQLDVLTSLHALWPKLAVNGIYIIEDTHTAYWQEWKGGINSPLNIVAVSSRFVHNVNLQHMKEPYTPVMRNLRSISYYDSMIVLEKELENKKETCSSGVSNITQD